MSERASRIKSAGGSVHMNKEELARQGWVKQTTYDEPRLSEIAEIYDEMGFEVLIEPFAPGDEPGCSVCMKHQPDRYKTIYTRKRNSS
jgi:hypothetical protein